MLPSSQPLRHSLRHIPRPCLYSRCQRISTSTIPPLEKRSVAGSFLFKFPESPKGTLDFTTKPKVALFRRSGQVKAYKHKYGPIAGSVEPSDATPLDAALREIHEETSLTSTQFRLLRRGEPYSFVDSDVSREWSIHPFSFVLLPPVSASEDAIKLDWEHEGYEWFDPEMVAGGGVDGVPKLGESFRRVWSDVD